MEVREPNARYLVKPGFKQTEVGVIPEDWGVSTIGEEFTIQLGKMLDAEKNVGLPKPFLGNRAVQWGRIDVADVGEIKLAPSELQRFRLRDGDLLVCEGGEVGRCAIWRQPMDECYYQKALHRLRPRRGFNVSLMLNLLHLYSMSGVLQNYVTQTSIAHLPKDKFETIPIPVPPTETEQQAIAEALSNADALIEALEQLLAKKRQIKQGAMQELLTGQKRLSGFAGEWSAKPLSELFDFSGGFTASRDQLGLDGHCYLHYGDIHTSNNTYVDVRAEFQDIPKLCVPLKKVGSAALLEDGDVVFVDASEDDEGTSKHIVVCNPDKTPFISGLHTIVAKSKGGVLDNLYKRYCFQTPEVRAQFRFFAVGTKVSGVSKSNIGKIVIFVPPVAEQTAIATILADLDAELAALETKLTKARQLKQGMMQELLTGRIRLVQPRAEVIPFPVKEVAKPEKGKSHNWQINEAVVISVLARHFGSAQWPLGRKRYTKLSYLLHRHVERQAEGYLKKRAGPYNPATKYGGLEGIALKNAYVRQHAREQFSGFVAGEHIDEAETYFRKWYGDDVLVWLEQFRRKTNEDLELLATVDMAMEDLRRAGCLVTLGSVKEVIRSNPEWQAKLDRPIFSDDNIERAIVRCKALFGEH